jgi:CRP-like cAMP-binding protein
MRYTKGSIVYFANEKAESIFILQSGSVLLVSVDIVTGASLSEQILAGGFFGIKSGLGHYPREETVRVLEDSRALMLTVGEFEELFKKNEHLLIKTLQFFSVQIRDLHRRIDREMQNNASPVIDQPAGMFEVAQCFYNDEQYDSCSVICKRLIQQFPDAYNREEVQKMLQDVEKRAKALHNLVLPPTGQEHSPDQPPITDGFDRFIKRFERNSIIVVEYEQGETFYLIRSGVVQTIKCHNGTKTNVSIMRPGEIFGEMAILEDSPRSASCVAMTDVEVLEFDKKNFEQMMLSNPPIALLLLKLLNKRLFEQQRRFKGLCIKDYSVRVADVFLMFSEKMQDGRTAGQKSQSFNLTIQDIAHWAAIPYDVAKNEIAKFAEKHRLEVFDDHILVSNMSDFQRMVELRLQQRR